MKDTITAMIRRYIKDNEKEGVAAFWGVPLVGFADARHPDILKLKETVGQTHKLPSDVLPDARIVIACFVPFTRELAYTNRSADGIASPEWARAYEETNAMFRRLNEHLTVELNRMGFRAAAPSEAYTFDKKKLVSNWSQRHFARAAGLGTFGLNNMLITKSGCCGRYGTLVTDLDVESDAPTEEEYCIFRRSGRCLGCVVRCPSGALTKNGFDRDKCYEVLKMNAELYTEFGSSYGGEAGGKPGSTGSEVCGKCVSNVPCSFFDRP